MVELNNKTCIIYFILLAEESMTYHATIVLSNLSACHIKNGNCREAISDCNKALTYLPHNTKGEHTVITAYTSESYCEVWVTLYPWI